MFAFAFSLSAQTRYDTLELRQNLNIRASLMELSEIPDNNSFAVAFIYGSIIPGGGLLYNENIWGVVPLVSSGICFAIYSVQNQDYQNNSSMLYAIAGIQIVSMFLGVVETREYNNKIESKRQAIINRHFGISLMPNINSNGLNLTLSLRL